MPNGPDLPELREPGINYAIYDEPVHPAWRDAWRMAEGTIKLMQDEVAQRNSRFGDRRGVGHWNRDGHRQAGEIISAWLCESLTARK